MNMRHRHPKNPWISNGLAARSLIFLTRHRIPFVSRFFMFALGCDIAIRMPKSVFLPHPFGIVIHDGAKIGSGVVVGHQVTLGGRDLKAEAPCIEDYVYIGAGAKLLGGITIGRGVTIGANAVVTKNVPPGAVVVGANRILANRSHYAVD